MESLNLNIKMLVIGSVFTLGLFGMASANEEKPRNINDLLCKDVLRTSGEDRAIALAFLHGYLLAKSGEDIIYRSKLSSGSDDFIEACLDDVNSKAVTTLGKQLK